MIHHQQRSIITVILKFVVVIAAFTSAITTGYNFTFLCINHPKRVGLQAFAAVWRYIFPSVQIAVALAFLMQAVSFLRLSHTSLSMDAYIALLKLGKLAVIAFACYIGFAVLNSNVGQRIQRSEHGYFVVSYSQFVLESVRGIALLAILGIDMPKKANATGESANGKRVNHEK